jgi:hypothetical protein
MSEKTNEEVESEIVAVAFATSDQGENDRAIIEICLKDPDPKRGATMLLGFAAGLARRAELTIEESDAAMRAGYGKPTVRAEPNA